MAHRVMRTLGLAAALVCVVAAAGGADLKTLTKDLFAVPSTTGNEEMLAAKICGLLPKSLTVEEAGLGTDRRPAQRYAGADARSRGPRRLRAHGQRHHARRLSDPRPAGARRRTPVSTPSFSANPSSSRPRRDRSRASSPSRRSILLTPERRRTQVEGFSLEIAYVDIGVRSEKDARAKGVELLDAITYPAVLTELAGDQWAGPGLGMKAVAAALVSVTEALAGRTGGEETVIAWAAQTKSAARGRGARPAIGAARAKSRWQPKRTIVVDVIAAGKGDGFPFPGGGPVLVQFKSGPSDLRKAFETAAAEAGASLQFLTTPDSPMSLPFEVPPAEVVTLALPVRFLNTPSEVVALKDLQALRDILERFLQPGGAK